jgi:hypothetical protein
MVFGDNCATAVHHRNAQQNFTKRSLLTCLHSWLVPSATVVWYVNASATRRYLSIHLMAWSPIGAPK